MPAPAAGAMSDARYAQLRDRLGQLWDVVKLTALAGWDQQTMMPPAAAPVRARQLATGSKLVHDLLVADELGELLEDLRPYEESLDYDSDEASLIRRTRHDREKELRVPAELREEQTRAAAEAFPVWVEARRTSNFELFRPYLPDWLGKVTLTNLRVGEAAVDLLFHRWRGTTSAEVLRKVGDIAVTIRL